MNAAARLKSFLFVVTSLEVALALVLGAAGCRRVGPPVTHGSGRMLTAPPPSPLEAGKDKGVPALAGGNGPPPPAAAPVPRSIEPPRSGQRPIGMPYRHDGARILRSASTGTPGTDSERGIR
jgi:hypothetical protein